MSLHSGSSLGIVFVFAFDSLSRIFLPWISPTLPFPGQFCAPILMLRETDTAPAHPQQLSWILPQPEELQQEHFKESRGAETAPQQHTVRQELIEFNAATKTSPKDPSF